METFVILWVLCAGLSYFIARDRAPSKAPLATLLGFLLGPIGVGLTFILKEGTGPNAAPVADEQANSDVTPDQAQPTESARPTRSLEEINADIARLKAKADS